ncbi:hypothetical protein [Pelagibacterium limicola]|uniref:hypothetical protein n=1 Tax=Pelagibacterium limicola TaxID=2791022 RepID=UPI0018AF68A6|nr:hypothetical protein [Pelagibacterium limicola]
MSAVTIAKTVLVVAIAASRNPAVRAAIKAAPNLLSDGQKAKAVETTRRAAYNAGVLAARLMSRNRTS